jgi:hypothetical protein
MKTRTSAEILVAALAFGAASAFGAAAPPLTAPQQIAAAVLAAPEDRRAGAAVLGYDDSGAVVQLRAGTNDLVCLADKPGDDHFSVACYHVSLEPFMKRGRELEAQGVTGEARLKQRWQEADAGQLSMPKAPATLYVLTGKAYDPASGAIDDSYLRFVVYTPYATQESTGLPLSPSAPGAPWIMFPGTAGAHIMINPPKDAPPGAAAEPAHDH